MTPPVPPPRPDLLDAIIALDRRVTTGTITDADYLLTSLQLLKRARAEVAILRAAIAVEDAPRP